MENKDIKKAVCPCRRVFFEDLEKAVAEGAVSFEDVQEKTQVSQGCGRCRKQAEEIVTHLIKQSK